VLSIVNIVIEFEGTYGGHVPCGVTAHGGPSGPLQFDRLEAALAAMKSILNSAKEKPEKAQIIGMDSPTSAVQASDVCV
jgi:hypothetical protein